MGETAGSLGIVVPVRRPHFLAGAGKDDCGATPRSPAAFGQAHGGFRSGGPRGNANLLAAGSAAGPLDCIQGGTVAFPPDRGEGFRLCAW